MPDREPAGLGFKIFTIFGILFFLAVVAILIGGSGNDNDGTDVQVVAPAVTTPAPATPSPDVVSQAPVGAVATGGGGVAGSGPGIMTPAFVVLVVLTMLATAGIVLRRQEA